MQVVTRLWWLTDFKKCLGMVVWCFVAFLLISLELNCSYHQRILTRIWCITLTLCEQYMPALALTLLIRWFFQWATLDYSTSLLSHISGYRRTTTADARKIGTTWLLFAKLALVCSNTWQNLTQPYKKISENWSHNMHCLVDYGRDSCFPWWLWDPPVMVHGPHMVTTTSIQQEPNQHVPKPPLTSTMNLVHPNTVCLWRGPTWPIGPAQGGYSGYVETTRICEILWRFEKIFRVSALAL